MPFAGIQLNEGETREDLIGAFAHKAAEVGSKFRIFKVYGVLHLGNREFLRFETDCHRKFIEAAAKKLDRGYIIANKAGKYVATSSNWNGHVSAMDMHTVPRPGWLKTFRGPGEPFWERQFKKAD